MSPRKIKLQKLLQIFSPDGTETDFSAFDSAVENLKTSLKEKIQVNTLEDVNAKLDLFRQSMDFTPLVDSVRGVEASLRERNAVLEQALSAKLTEFAEISNSDKVESQSQLGGLSITLEELRTEILQQNTQLQEIEEIKRRINAFPNIDSRLADIRTLITTSIKEIPQDATKADKGEVVAALEALEVLRRELTNRINNIAHGGNANRNIAIGGNTSALSLFTDINLKAGTNVTITYSANQTTKYTDITISATGGGGSVGGVVRSINTISTSQTAGNAAGTDYVYLCSAGVNLTLPAASGNTNLYTIKNISNSSVLVSGTIDNDAAGVIMPIKYTSIDVISNNTDWDIT